MTQHPRPDSLDHVLETVWTELEIGAAKAKHGFHQPALATVDAQGLPYVRTVVLRKADRVARIIACHTDARSPKLDHLRTQPVAAWLLYDKARRLQVRATGPVTIHTDDTIADEHWTMSPNRSRRCYAAPHTPGAGADHPSPNLPDELTDRDPTTAESESGRPHFAVLRCRIETIDTLELHHDGHVRARFTLESDRWKGSWIEP